MAYQKHSGFDALDQRIENLGAPDSDDDAARRDTIDEKIAIHEGDATAHHPAGHYETETDLSYYVDATNGLDTNAGTEGSPFKTIAYAISKIPKLIKHTVYIYLKKGETWNEAIELFGFRCVAIGSSLSITHYGVGAAPQVLSCHVKNCWGDIIQVTNVAFTTTTTHAVRVDSSNLIRIGTVTATGADAAHAGLLVMYGAHVYVNVGTFSNKKYGMWTCVDSIICSKDGGGVNNTVGIRAEQGAVIAKDGAQPGGIAAEETASGGVIR